MERPTDPNPATTDLIGRVLNSRYELVECLNAGKQVSVYRARRLPDGLAVAVKLLPASDTEADQETRLRFHRECRATAMIDHPHVIKIHETADTAEGWTFFVMELLEGTDLLRYLRLEGPLPLVRAVDIFLPTCRALHAAHQVGIVHRDVKPSNVFLHRARTGEIVKVLDFGIAKPRWQGAGPDIYVTGQGTVVGTPQYMSPEQCAGNEVDFRSDIYSLGILLYRMLVGNTPFDGPPSAVLARHVGAEPPPMCVRRPGLPAEIERVVLKALAKKPENRYGSTLEFAAAFGEAVGNHSTPESDALHPRITPPEENPDAIACQTVILRPGDIIAEPSGSFPFPLNLPQK